MEVEWRNFQRATYSRTNLTAIAACEKQTNNEFAIAVLLISDLIARIFDERVNSMTFRKLQTTGDCAVQTDYFRLLN